MEQIDFSEVIASPVLNGRISNYMWTGCIKSENITPVIIEDDTIREEFVQLAKDLEECTRRYRELFSQKQTKSSVLRDKAMSEREFFFESSSIKMHIDEIADRIIDLLASPEEHRIDIELFWIELCREYEEILEKNPKEFKEMRKEDKDALEDFRKSYMSTEPAIREFYLDQNRYACYQFPTRYQEKKYSKTSEDNEKQLLDIIKSIAGKDELTLEEEMEILGEISEGITAWDLIYLFQSRKFAEMQYITHLKNYLLEKGYDTKSIEKMSLEHLRELVTEFYDNDSIEFHSYIMANTIMDNIECIDLEKLMLLSMCRPLEAFCIMNPKYEEVEKSEDLETTESQEKDILVGNIDENTSMYSAIAKTRRVEYIIQKILETGIVSTKTKFSVGYGELSREYSLRRLKELMTNYCDGIYLNNVMESNLKYTLYVSEDAMSDWSDELIQRMDFSINDKMATSIMNFANLQRLYSLGKIDKKDIKKMLEEIYFDERDGILDQVSSDPNSRDSLLKRNTKDFLKNLYNSGIVDESEIFKYYTEGIITDRMLESLEDGKSEEELQALYSKMRDVLNQDTLLRKYNEYIKKYIEFTTLQTKSPEDSKKIEELREDLNALRKDKNDFRKMFLKYNSSITDSERHRLGDSLLEKYYIEMDITDEKVLQETIRVLYEDGLIDLENIIHLDKNYVIPMLDELSLEDAAKIRKSMSFNELEDLLDDIFSDDKFSDERRFIIAMNLLGEDTEEDKAAREFYLSLLTFEEGSERKAKPTGNKKNFTGEGTKESKKYIYPDFVKWKFYKALDKDVRVTRYANGFVEFASKKLNSRIIEKYYNGNEPAYGTATYILTEQDYRNNQSDLVTITPEGSILESATLREITPRKDRIAHRTQSTDRTWMDEIVKYFDIDYERENDTRYTKEELKTLQSVVQKYKTEYEMIK